jgi:HTH-type transcriptional regulator/antitoxin HipB
MSLIRDTAPRNPEQLGRAIRLKRQEKGTSQSELATQVRVGRKWVMHLEAGNPKAQLGLVLKTLDALQLQTTPSETTPASPGKGNRSSRLDEVFNRLQRPRK